MGFLIVREMSPEEVEKGKIPSGEIWFYQKDPLKNFMVACADHRIISLLRGFPLPIKFYKVLLWEPRGVEELKKRIELAETQVYNAN